MKKGKLRSIQWILILTMLVNMLPVSAAATSVVAGWECGWSSGSGDKAHAVLTDDGVLTITGKGHISGHPWEQYKDQIITVEMGDGITWIGLEAFRNCKNLCNIDLPESLTNIDDKAFYGCSSLALPALPLGVTRIGQEAFRGCSSLTLEKLPEGLSEINSNVFNGCSSLALTELPSGLTVIGESAFYGCSSLALTELPSGLTHIGRDAFYECSSLALTKLPEGITKIDFNTFYGCSSLALTELPEGITEIRDGAFGECSSLALKELPEKVSLNTIRRAFNGASWCFQTEHYIPDGKGGYTRQETTEALTTTGMAVADVKDYSSNNLAPTTNPNELLEKRLLKSASGYGYYIPHGEAIVLRRYYDFEKVSVTIKDDQGGTTTQEVSYGSTAIEPEIDARPGHTLSWETEDGDPFTFDTPITEAITISPVWTANKITVTIKDDQGGTTTQEVSYGSMATEPEIDARPGYTLSWETEDGDPFTFDTPITKPVTVQCRYDPIPQPDPPVPSIPVDNDDDDDGDNNPFNDVKPGNWYYKDVLDAYHAGYIEGATYNTFRPDAPFTRAQAAYAFAKMSRAKLRGLKITRCFRDVTTATTYVAAITWANDAEVEIGYGNGCFGPKDGITREQLALTLYRQYGNQAEAPELDAEHFCDVGQVSDWAAAAMRWAVHVELLEGTDAGELLPQDVVTRAEAAALLIKAQGLRRNVYV